MLWLSGVLFSFSLSVFVLSLTSSLWLFEWSLMLLPGSYFSFVFIFDFFSFFFSSVVLFIASVIFFFSQYYMDSDKYPSGFIFLLFLFVLSMMSLIYSPSLVSLLLGWDGLGLVSYLLVVYYMSYSSSVAGMLTFLSNRVGDVFFLLSLSIMALVGTWDFVSFKVSLVILSVFLIMTFVTKSAQFPFSSWLPAAMAAPTPVSSLVHSSTLVTAGVYLLVRYSYVLYSCLSVVMFLSFFTLFSAGIMALFEWDMKKLIAFSTLSQLGFMIVAVSFGLFYFCFFHLLTHALFKASLFMVSGVMIHNMDSSQEFRNFASFVNVTPMVSSSVVVCVLCLVGFPFVSGYFSKDLILDGASGNFAYFFLFFILVLFTSSYSLRFTFYVFLSYFNVRAFLLKIYESLYYVVFAIWLLVLSAVFLGFFWFQFFMEVCVLSMFGVFWKIFYFFSVGLVFYVCVKSYFSYLSVMYFRVYFLSALIYLKEVFSLMTLKSVVFMSGVQDKFVSQGWLENMGPQGSYITLFSLGSISRLAQTFSYLHVLFFIFVIFFVVF